MLENKKSYSYLNRKDEVDYSFIITVKTDTAQFFKFQSIMSKWVNFTLFSLSLQRTNKIVSFSLSKFV